MNRLNINIVYSIFVKCALLITAQCFSTLSFAQSQLTTLTIVTDDAPPHMIKENNSGIDVDITRAALAQLGYQSEMHYAPLHRSRQLVKMGTHDVFLPTFEQQDSDGLYFSKPIIQYRPTAFTLSKNHLSIKTITDLARFNVVSFQGATGYFGAEYQQAVTQGKYRELHDMSKFPEMLLRSRTQVVVLDYYIFYYFLKKYTNGNPISSVTAHPIIPPVNAHVGFNNEQLRDNFNQALAIIQNQGMVTKVIDNYIDN